MFLVKNSDDPDVALFVLINLHYDSGVPECFRPVLDGARTETMSRFVQLCFRNRVPGPQAPTLSRHFDLGKHSPADQARSQREFLLSRQKESVQKLQKEFFKQQLQNVVKKQQKQQQEMATIFRDLMKIENETLIRKMNDPNPLVCLLATQVAGKKRLPVEKEAIGLLSSGNPTIRQAARQTLIRLARGVDYGPDASASPQQVAVSARSWSSWLDVQGNEAEADDGSPSSRTIEIESGKKDVTVPK